MIDSVTNLNTAQSSYPTYTDHKDGDCAEPNPPVPVYFGGINNKYVGDFDAAAFTMSVDYSDQGITVARPFCL